MRTTAQPRRAGARGEQSADPARQPEHDQCVERSSAQRASEIGPRKSCGSLIR